MSDEWTFVQVPGASTTPLKLRNPMIDNLQQENKKRGPTTPLTPTLINKNNKKLKEEGSPKNRRNTPLKEELITPKMAKGIKIAVKDHKLSRLQMLRQSESNIGNVSINSDGDYSEASSISGDTPNYKINGNLLYYKNGYYIDNDVDDSFYDLQKENIIQSRELSRLNDVLEFTQLEKKFENE